MKERKQRTKKRAGTRRRRKGYRGQKGEGWKSKPKAVGMFRNARRGCVAYRN